jgi:hypothetical protein
MTAIELSVAVTKCEITSERFRYLVDKTRKQEGHRSQRYLIHACSNEFLIRVSLGASTLFITYLTTTSGVSAAVTTREMTSQAFGYLVDAKKVKDQNVSHFRFSISHLFQRILDLCHTQYCLYVRLGIRNLNKEYKDDSVGIYRHTTDSMFNVRRRVNEKSSDKPTTSLFFTVVALRSKGHYIRT